MALESKLSGRTSSNLENQIISARTSQDVSQAQSSFDNFARALNEIDNNFDVANLLQRLSGLDSGQSYRSFTDAEKANIRQKLRSRISILRGTREDELSVSQSRSVVVCSKYLVLLLLRLHHEKVLVVFEQEYENQVVVDFVQKQKVHLHEYHVR